MSAEHCTEADREFVQFYHRRVAWLALQRYDRALLDADHTLALMDFVCRHGDDEEYIASHERFRGLVLFHRTQAAAALALERRKPEEAIDVVREGVDRLAAHHENGPPSTTPTRRPNQSLIEQLRVLEHEIRKNFAVEKTLREQLDEAVAVEDYERAARLRDQIRAGRGAERIGRVGVNGPLAPTSRRARRGRRAPRRRRGGGRSSRRPGGSGRRN